MKQFLLKLSVAFFLGLVFISQQVEAKNTELIWSKKSKINYQGYIISKKCFSAEDFDNNCEVKVIKNRKKLASFKAQKNYWVNYGFFNFLGGKNKQLVIHTYSGGAHCCYDYAIFDLKPTFRKIYDSSKFNQIGNKLIPIDIDKDGVFEIEQSVMTFDSFHVSYSSSVFPPAIFAFNNNRGFEIANKKFANYILEKKNKNSKWLETTYGKDDANYKQGILHLTFAYLVYAGKEKEAWKYFDENYYLNDRETFRTEIKTLFAKDSLYLSIYGK